MLDTISRIMLGFFFGVGFRHFSIWLQYRLKGKKQGAPKVELFN